MAIARFLRSEATRPPLTIAVVGDWGTGKTSLLALLRDELRSHGIPVVWFDAWQHEDEEDLLAALLRRLGDAVPRWWSLRGAVYHGRLLAIRVARRQRLLWTLATIVVLVSGYLAVNPDASLRTNLGAWIPSAEQFVRASKFVGVMLLTATPVLALLVSIVELLRKGRTLSGSVGRRELRRRRNFRARVAEDLADIARALEPRTVTMLVDELDRCRPRALIDVLGAVQFVASAGHALAVIAMARDTVERNIGIHFASLDSDVVTRELGTLESEGLPLKTFAGDYLNRLIDLQVAVPLLPPALHPMDDSSLSDPRLPPYSRWSFSVRRLLPRVLVLGAAGMGAVLGRQFPPAAAAAPAVLLGGVRLSWLGLTWFSCLIAGGLLVVAYSAADVLDRRVRRSALEEGDLGLALRVWAPLIAELNPTPTLVMQFVNHARLLASFASSDGIRVSTIVSLLALRKVVPLFFEGNGRQTLGEHIASISDARLRALVDVAAKEHQDRFGLWPPSAEDVSRFSELLTRAPVN